jgi:hypothetical protein
MNVSKKMILALGLLVAGAGYAQTATTSSSSLGLLGQRYAEVSLGTQDVTGFSNNFYDAGLAVNLPVSPSVDLSVGYGYSWLRSGIRGHANTVFGAGTFYVPMNGVKPFVTGALGYQWTRVGGFQDNGGVWAGIVGVEIPVGALTLTPRVAYADDFESGSSRDFTYEVEGNYWLSAKTAVYGTIGRTEVHRSNADSWNYELGLRFKF